MADSTTKTGITVESVKSDDLYGVVLGAQGESGEYPDLAIFRRIRAAEDFIERDCGIRFQRTRVFSDVWGRQNGVFPANSSMELPVNYDPLVDLDEPAYNYPETFFSQGRWGYFTTNYRPIIGVTKVAFGFPGLQPLFQVPTNWIRLDRKGGIINIVPAGAAVLSGAFSAFVLGLASGSAAVPQSIYVDHEIGFIDGELEAHHQDLLDAVRLRTVLSIGGVITTIAAPGGRSGGSLSVDGLSESKQYAGKFGPYTGKITLAIEQEREIRESWKRHEQGLLAAVA